MSHIFYPYEMVLDILRDKGTLAEEREIKLMLEDTTSPIRKKSMEKLFDEVINKNHVDFDDIPTSKGDITKYKGYQSMLNVISCMESLIEEKHTALRLYIDTIKESIRNIENLAPLYTKAFRAKCEIIMLEYNTFVYTLVQATSVMIYESVDYVRMPSQGNLKIMIKNNKYNASEFYLNALTKFNNINKNMDYKKYIEGMIQNQTSNFTGAELVGLATVTTVALAIVPVTREIIYQFYKWKASISNCLAQQAYFLEMNKMVVTANTSFSKKEREEILKKQEKIKNQCLRLSEKLRVSHVKSIDMGKASLKADNKLMTLDNIKKEVSDSPLQLL